MMKSLARSRACSRYLWIAFPAVFLLVLAKFVSLHFLPPRATPWSPSSATTAISRPPDSELPIPRQIWQIFFPPPNARTLDMGRLYSSEWIAMAPGYTYTMVGEREANDFLNASFSSRPEIAATYHALQNPALKSDLLRYLLLLARGGTYTDVDTRPLVPLEDWLPDDKRRAVRLVVAPEFDRSRDRPYWPWVHPVQFCQWTIAAAPGHPILARMVDRTVEALHRAARQQGTTLDRADFDDSGVLNTTGPVPWSEVILDWIKEVDPSVADFTDFYNLEEQRYFGDLAVMPLESFRADGWDDWGVGGWRKGRRPLVRHYYKGQWRKIPAT